MIWFTADEHYYHHNMLLFRHNGSRKFRATDEMHKVLKQKHNEVVAPTDLVYHLGDFAYGPGAKSWQQIESLLKVLNGTHILVLGNHDHIKTFDYVEAGFQSVHTSLQFEEFLLIHDPAVAGVLPDLKVIHGHTHGLGLRLHPNTYSVSVEMHDMYPVSLDQIRESW